jgi:hypothetical protein
MLDLISLDPELGAQAMGSMVLEPETLEQRILQDYNYCLYKYRAWRKRTRESYGFYSGFGQWEIDGKDVKRELQSRNPPQPAITINQILSIVNIG